MPFGQVFSKFKQFNAETAEGKIIKFHNNWITRLGFLILGVPHIGMRLRARKIMKDTPKRIDKLLDAGCGTGVYSLTLLGRARKVIAIDIESEKIKHLRNMNSSKGIDFIKADLCNLPFSNEEFDTIICSDVLEHIEKDSKAFSELARVLKKRGVLLMTLPYNSEWNRKVYKYYKHSRAGYDEKMIKNLAEKNNLTIKKISGYSYALADKVSNYSYKFSASKVAMGLLFYPLYILAMLGDALFRKGQPNGIYIMFSKDTSLQK